MKQSHRLAFLLMSIVFHAHAYKEDPHQSFPTSKNTTNKTTITWTPVDNVQKRCEAESHKRVFGGFNYPVEACSFWASNTCQIVTAKFVNFHTLGHEVRHCFQGEFHAH